MRATPDGGIALGLLAPVVAPVALRAGAAAAVGAGGARAPVSAHYTGANVTVTVVTDYPFNDTLAVTVDNVPAGGVPMYLRCVATTPSPLHTHLLALLTNPNRGIPTGTLSPQHPLLGGRARIRERGRRRGAVRVLFFGRLFRACPPRGLNVFHL